MHNYVQNLSAMTAALGLSCQSLNLYIEGSDLKDFFSSDKETLLQQRTARPDYKISNQSLILTVSVISFYPQILLTLTASFASPK